jgi:arylsulfatase A-like enzyme
VAAKTPPNIVIFLPDQFRADALAHLGNPASKTPHLDAVVKDGVSFTSAFAQNPVCTPSRCSFMTGWYPHVAGHRTMVHMLREHEPVLLRTLKEHGYFVWWGGKNDLVPGQRGYDLHCDAKYTPEGVNLRPNLHEDMSWRGPPGSDEYYSFYAGKIDKEGEEAYRNEDVARVEAACDFIRKPPAGKPFVVYLPLSNPHPPYGVEEPFYSSIDRARVPERIPAPEGWKGKPSMLKGIWEEQGLKGWTEERWTELRATYLGMCARTDHQFGMVMQALRDADLYDDTAVFFFSDHGDFTGDYGLVEKTQNTFEDVLTRVPFLIKPPRGVPVAPRVSGALVELTDFPATVEALTGIGPFHTHFGRSLLPVIAGTTDEHRDAVFCEGGRRHGETHCMERESHFGRSPEGLYSPRGKFQRAEGPEHTKAVMVRTKRFKYVRRLYESDELYDLESDPGELHNRIDDPALGGVLAELKERMLTFFLETGDAVPWDLDRRW